MPSPTAGMRFALRSASEIPSSDLRSNSELPRLAPSSLASPDLYQFAVPMAPFSSCQQSDATSKISNVQVTLKDLSGGSSLEDKNATSSLEEASAEIPPLRVVWQNVILYGYVHLAAVYGAYLMCTSAMWQTNLFAFALYQLSGLGVTAGIHRLWSHRTYKAKLPLRIVLAFFFTMSFQNDIYVWARNHRVHHKYSETTADPHDSNRGFFFAHIGWAMCRKHPDVIEKGRTIDTSDLLADPVVRWQRKFYLQLVLVSCFLLPTIIPMYFWNESFSNSFFIAAIFRFIFTLHQTFLVNSAAHMWGNRPYDATIRPADNMWVVIGASGEGFHNYHHAFPFDYATSEYGIKYNLTTMFIDTMAWLGLAYDRKSVSKEAIAARKMRTGKELERDKEER